MLAGKIFGVRSDVIENRNTVQPVSSFYDLTATAADGTVIDFNRFKGTHVLIVNTASDCGYTNQLSALEKLHRLYKEKLMIIGFPSNDFKEQEKLSDNAIASFCMANFGVTFLIVKKSFVVKGDRQNHVFDWLSNKKKNGWNDKAPEWNFSKYLVNKKGILTHYFGPGVEPLSKAITTALVLTCGLPRSFRKDIRKWLDSCTIL